MRRPMLMALLAFLAGFGGVRAQTAVVSVTADFDDALGALTEADRQFFRRTASDVAREMQALLPDFASTVRVRVLVGERDLSALGGVTGRADAPGEVMIAISSSFPGGVAGAMRAGLRSVLFHEFHHLSRGWTIRENQFGPGIPTAVVNEGLAAVFADTYSDQSFEGYEYPANAHEWLEEILGLPLDANYNAWMNEHPDGRMGVGYRVGRYVVHRALEHSGLDVIQLSALAPEEILAMVER